MIQANELRIGNWVLDYYGRPRQVAYVGEVVGLHNGMGGTDRYQKNPIISYDLEKDLHPIPLSPEILEKCGWQKDGDEEGEWYTDLSSNGVLFLEGDKNGLCEVFLDMDNSIRVRFLHQLQNLFWCLCGKELEIDLH
jgi:hypothetical protein